MGNSPFFTILTASLNSDSTLRKTLETVKNQNFEDLEHIVIDGGSQDGTLDMLKSYEKSYNLKWFSEADGGIADALNKGLRYARGKYILVIHADDYLLSPSILEKTYTTLQKDYDIHCFSVVFERPALGIRIGNSYRPLWWHRFRNIFSHQGAFVHRRVFSRIGNFNENLSISLDYDFFYRALDHGCSVKFERFPIAMMGGKGISGNIKKRLEDEFRVQKANEINPFWRIAQHIFQMLYAPYKLRLLPKVTAAITSIKSQSKIKRT